MGRAAIAERPFFCFSVKIKSVPIFIGTLFALFKE
jgi:hypothetical protein